jgi:hypothetical protein
VQEGRLYDSTVGTTVGTSGYKMSYKTSVKKATVPLKNTNSDSSKSVNAKGTSAEKKSTPSPSSRDSNLRVLKTIPSIIYGQAVVTMAKGGAESQSYHIFCEMLEAGIVPSTMTANNVIMELSKRGSYKVAISILDQLERYQVSVSKEVLNSLLNACEKVGIWSDLVYFSLTLYFSILNLSLYLPPFFYMSLLHKNSMQHLTYPPLTRLKLLIL